MGPRQRFIRQRGRRVAPGDALPRQHERRRKVATNLIQIMQHGNDGSSLGVPSVDETQQLGDGGLIDGGKWLVEEKHGGVLQQQAGEQRALELAYRQVVDRAAAKTVE